MPVACCLFVLAPALAHAEDRVDTTITWFQERRVDANALQVVHPQFDLGLDLGEKLSLNAGYEADIVSGATEALYAAPAGPGVDVVSSATEFKDTRHSGKASLSLQGRRSRLSVGYVYGTEVDYRSHTVLASGSVDLPGKNTSFGLSYAHNFDRVCDFDNGDATPLERRPLTLSANCFKDVAMNDTTGRDVTIDTTEASVTQNVSPTMVVQFGVYGQIIDGFQSNPYRRVRVGDVDAQESVPDVRARLALFARANIAFPGIHGALGAMVRGYNDTWGIESLTLEMSYSQYLGKTVLFRFRTRIYQQSAAVFFEDALDYRDFGAPGEFWTGDRELSPFRQELVGGKLSYLKQGEEGRQVWGAFDELDFHLRAEGVWGQSLTDTAPGGDPSGPLPDMLVVSLGLLLRY